MSQETLSSLYGRNVVRILTGVPNALKILGFAIVVYLYVVSPLLAVIGLMRFGYIPSNGGWQYILALAAPVAIAYLVVIIPLGLAITERWGSEGEG